MRFSLVSLISLFFLWGLLTSLNDILVPHLKAAFELQHWQAQLIQFFFFGAYFLMSWPAGWIIQKVGYKRGIVYGLLLMGVGCFVFYPASIVHIYGVFLLGLFILASGITILQVAANPYVAIIGPPETAASRLNLAQGFNSLGHTIAPLFGAWLILQNQEVVDVKTVQGPYIFLALALVVIGLTFRYLELPKIEYEEPERKGFSLWRYPHLYLGGAAIFCYVGAEIAIGSFLVEYFKAEPTIGLDNKTAGSHVAFYWGGAMVGRFLGAIALSGRKTLQQRAVQMLPIPALAVAVVVTVVMLNDLPLSMAGGFAILLGLNYLAFLFGKHTSQGLLAFFALCCMALLGVTMLGHGDIALWAVLGVGLFNSIMWSNIFTLAIRNLKQYTSLGSSILVMMIVGGAIIPLVQGLAADAGLGVKGSFLIPFLAYAYLVFYGLKGWRFSAQE
jgi:FHS family L-fucose permease-like MFS transporter